MPGASDISRGNISYENVIQINIAAGTVGTTTIVNVTTSVAGLLVGDFCSLSPMQWLWAASQPALNIDPGAAYCGTNGILTVCFQNATGSALTQTTALPYELNVARVGNYSIGLTLPTALV